MFTRPARELLDPVAHVQANASKHLYQIAVVADVAHHSMCTIYDDCRLMRRWYLSMVARTFSTATKLSLKTRRCL
jgi:hypothetical protein